MMRLALIIIAVGFAFVSCRKVIDLDLKESDPLVVLKGEVTSGETIHNLNITKSVAFDQSNDFPGVIGAQVVLTDDLGATETLVDLGDGNYQTTNYLASEGRSYTFVVTIDGEVYESTSTIPELVPLTGVDFLPTSFFGDTGFILVPKYFDPAGVKNSYLFSFYNKNDPEEESGFIYANDDFADGQENEQPFFGDYTPDSGDTVIYNMWGIDENVYTYYFSLDQNTDPNAGAPANPVSNWSNNALGYFTAQNEQTIEVVAPL